VKNLYWNLDLFDGTTSYNLITTATTQNVSRIHLENCNTTYPTKTLNFTAFNEQNLSRINPYSFEGTFDFWLGNGFN